jgi:hypothetical protein
MTTCPQCGRVADGEIVCAQCGKFLAPPAGQQASPPVDENDTSTGLMNELGFTSGEAPRSMNVRTSRVLAFAVVTCALVAFGAIVLLHQHNGPSSNAAQPLVTASGTPSGASFAPLPTAITSPLPSATRHTHSARPTRSRAHPRSTTASASATPTEVATTRTTTAPRTPTPSPTRPVSASVVAGKGSPGFLCGPHCFYVNVTLSGFPAGTHSIACHSQRRGEFAGYATSSRTSAVCEYAKQNDTVWVLVDSRYQSNTVQW